MSFKSLDSKAKGMGSSKFATLHFIRQRLTAIVLLPLFIWLAFSVVNIFKASSSQDFILFVSSPLNFSLILISLFSFLYHAYLGMEDILKDYVHCKTLYKILHKLLFLVCVVTFVVSFVNFLFYHLLFRYFTGIN